LAASRFSIEFGGFKRSPLKSDEMCGSKAVVELNGVLTKPVPR
jgi:hypothetical protein